jgi:hypothetical protein
MSEEERLTILEWLESLKKNNKLRSLSNRRWDYTLHIDNNTIPIAVWKIKKRLIEREGLHTYRQDPAFEDILTLLPNGSILHPHTDPNSFDGSIHCRFNVFVNVPNIFDTYYGEYRVEAKNRHYVMCRSGIDMHWSSENKTDDRVALSFGYILPMKKINELYIIPKNAIVSSLKVSNLYISLINYGHSFTSGV